MNRFVAIMMIIAGSVLAVAGQVQPQGSSGSSDVVTQFAEARDASFSSPEVGSSTSWDPSFSSAPFASKLPTTSKSLQPSFVKKTSYLREVKAS